MMSLMAAHTLLQHIICMHLPCTSPVATSLPPCVSKLHALSLPFAITTIITQKAAHRDDVTDAAHTLPQHVVRHLEGILDGNIAVHGCE